jgi:hypothetical protein
MLQDAVVAKKRKKKLPFDASRLKHWRLLEAFAQRLDQAQESLEGEEEQGGRITFEDPRRKLARNDYLSLLRIGISSHPVSLGSFSEAQSVIDPVLLEKVFMDLVGEETSGAAVINNPSLERYRRVLTAVDGTLWEALPRMAWAQWRTQHQTQRAVKMELKFNILDDRPVGAKVGPGNTCEKVLLRPQLSQGEFYVGDRYYGKDYKLLESLEEMMSSYVIRLHDNAVVESVENLVLSEEDRKAGIIEDCWARVGSRSKGPLRRVVVIVIATGEEIRVVTNKGPEELSAELIAQIYRYRWQVELFFKWLKSILGCRHWFAESPDGVAIQVYTALIGALLLARWCGRKKPTKRQMELLQFYFMGYAGLEELERMLPGLAAKKVKKAR